MTDNRLLPVRVEPPQRRRRLDRFSREQLAELAPLREGWLARALATRPPGGTHRRRALAALHHTYAQVGLPPPSLVLWFASPPAGGIAALLLSSRYVSGRMRQRLGAPIAERVWGDRLSAAINLANQQTGTAAWGQVLREVIMPIDRQIDRDILNRELSRNVYSGWSKWWHQIQPELRDQLRSQLGHQGRLGYDLPDDAPSIAMWQLDDDTHRGYCMGHYDAAGLALLHAFHRLGVAAFDAVRGMAELSAFTGPWWPFQHAAILTDPPVLNLRDDQGRLHAEDGPALAYADGWSIYAWRGQRVDERIITKPLTTHDWMTEGHRRTRRVIAERIGYLQLLDDCRARGRAYEVGRDEYGTLWVIGHPAADEEDIVLVEVNNSTPEPDGTIKRYALRVPPAFGFRRPPTRRAGNLFDARMALRQALLSQPLPTSQPPRPADAIAWTFGLAAGEYAPAAMT